jgi:hypothetical protein
MMEYYATTKKNEILSFVAKWIELEGIMLSERRQTQKEKYQLLSHMWQLKKAT